MSEQPEDTPAEDPQAAQQRGQQLMAALGTMWQPVPVRTQWVGSVNKENGQQLIIMVMSTALGSMGYAFDPDGLESHANEAMAMARKGRTVQAPITIAKAMPQGMPMPGVDPAAKLRQRGE